MRKNYFKKLMNYIKNVYNIERGLYKLKDGRIGATYNTGQVIFTVLLGFLLRIRSFNELNYMLKENELYSVFRHFNITLVAWVRRKYKRFRRHKTKACIFLQEIAKREPALFEHWKKGMRGAFA